MNGAYATRTLLLYGAEGLVAVLAAVLIVAGTVVRAERRKQFLLWCLAAYISGWTLFVLYNTVVLTKYLLKLIRG